jgi:hypothetical protein
MVKFYAFFVGIIALALGGLLFINAGYYPVALVDREIITARQLYKNYEAAALSLKSLQEAYQSFSWREGVEAAEVQASVLEQLIENVLVHDEVKRQLGDDFEAILEEKVREVRENSALQEASKEIFGFQADELRDEVLVPLAEREMLIARLYLEGKSLTEWLREKKKEGSIRIFSGQLYWTGEGIAVR